ncbi:MAG: tail fiber domain-containing protein [Bacteroidetes bacterium]|nr:tail fiber domain-containing protein [Bacteroidota bacterium]
MKKLLLTLTFALLATQLFAQNDITNTLGDNGFFYIKDATATPNTWFTLQESNGNVGIGTTNAISPLDRSGNITQASGNGLFQNIYYGAGGWKYRGNGYGTGLYQGASGELSFSTFSNNTDGAGVEATENQRLVITNAGNVGIGTTSPSYKLDISSGNNPGIRIGPNTSFSRSLLLGGWNDTDFSEARIQSSIGNLHLDAKAGPGVSGIYLNHYHSGDVYLVGGGGNVGIGTTTPGARLHIAGFGYGIVTGIAMTPVNDTEGGHYITFHNTVGTAIGSIARGSGENVVYNTTSDYRLKENVVNIDINQAKSRLMALRPVEYNYISDQNKTVISGFLAHEMAEAGFANGVTGEKDAVDKDGKPIYQAIDTKFLIPEMVKVIQEQQKQINKLESANSLLAQKLQIIDELKVELVNLQKALENKDSETPNNQIRLTKLENK